MNRNRKYPMGLDVSPQDKAAFWYNPERIDPRVATTRVERDRMIRIRKESGLPEWPAEPIYPELQALFEPPGGSRLVS